MGAVCNVSDRLQGLRLGAFVGSSGSGDLCGHVDGFRV